MAICLLIANRCCVTPVEVSEQHHHHTPGTSAVHRCAHHLAAKLRLVASHLRVGPDGSDVAKTYHRMSYLVVKVQRRTTK